jgi:hypothetical protein
VIRQQAAIQTFGARLEHPVPDPTIRISGETDLPAVRIDLLTVADLDFLARQP